jgi:hypothetical protein
VATFDGSPVLWDRRKSRGSFERGGWPAGAGAVDVRFRGAAGVDPPEAEVGRGEGDGEVDPGLVPLQRPVAARGLVGHRFPQVQALDVGLAGVARRVRPAAHREYPCPVFDHRAHRQARLVPHQPVRQDVDLAAAQRTVDVQRQYIEDGQLAVRETPLNVSASSLGLGPLAIVGKPGRSVPLVPRWNRVFRRTRTLSRPRRARSGPAAAQRYGRSAVPRPAPGKPRSSMTPCHAPRSACRYGVIVAPIKDCPGRSA